MRVEQLASVVCIVPFGLQPDREVVLIVALTNKLGESTLKIISICDDLPKELNDGLTIRRRKVGHVGVVSSLAGEDRHARWAANSRRCVVALVESALIEQMLLDQRHVIQRVHVKVLIIRQDEENVRS